MGFRPHGRARVNANSPQAFGRCDRCGFIYTHKDLRFQFDYRGPQLQNLRFLVCETCLDKPQPQLKPVILSADPMPIVNARPEDYYYANTQGLATAEPSTTYQQTGIPVPQGELIITEDGIYFTAQPIGQPVGLDPNAVMPLIDKKHYNVVLPVVSIYSNGTTVVTVTTLGTHGLVDNDQVTVEDLKNNKASGFFSIKYVSATVFSYEVAIPINSDNLLTSNTRVATAKIGLPPGYAQIPQVGAA